MKTKLKYRVKMIPLTWTPGAKFAKEREIDVIIEDTGNAKQNHKQARKTACIETDSNRLNYAFGITNLAIAEKAKK